jgi:hypothetical protein
MYYGHRGHSYCRNYKVDCAENQSVPPVGFNIQGIPDHGVEMAKMVPLTKCTIIPMAKAALPWGNIIEPIICAMSILGIPSWDQHT